MHRYYGFLYGFQYLKKVFLTQNKYKKFQTNNGSFPDSKLHKDFPDHYRNLIVENS